MKRERYTTIKSATLTDVFNATKERLIEQNLSMDEVAINANVPEELIAILFDSSNNIVNDISRIISFSGINIRYRMTTFDDYKFRSIGKSKYRVWREIKPKCTIVYDNADGKLYNFNCKWDLSDEYRQLIINEFYDFCTEHINV